jgi:hydroxymethylpyrimidine pyrophosphatase-like HAD family hydrolase
MRYVALATDYDGTIALHGQVDEPTLEALRHLKASGRRVVLVTGRELDDLSRVFPHMDLFDRIVAENGAVLYDPATRTVRPLAEPPPDEFVRELERRQVTPLSRGHVIVATWHPQEHTVFEVIRDLQLELQVVFNKGAVMVLPTGINKAIGLRLGLADLGLSLHNAVGVGDAENDQTFLAACECGVAVSNALDSVKARVDLVTAADHGPGVAELIERLIDDDLRSLEPKLARHHLLLGHHDSGDEVRVPTFGRCLLVAGPSGAGKTSVTTSFLERLAASGYQYCIIDPEGDYKELPDTVSLDGSEPRPLVDAVLEVVAKPDQSVAVSLFKLRLDDRPGFFGMLLPRLQELRASTGRPHWIIVDEAHHLVPSGWEPAQSALPTELTNLVLVTVHPDHVAKAALSLVDTMFVVGRDAASTVEAFARGRESRPFRAAEIRDDAPPGECWMLSTDSAPIRFKIVEPSGDRRRHRRKYAQGELGPDKSFFFRGPDQRLNLRAQNLTFFAQLAEGVDDDTWTHHLHQGDYSSWIREAIKDDVLADEVSMVEELRDLPPTESRERILSAIRERYTSPS